MFNLDKRVSEDLLKASDYDTKNVSMKYKIMKLLQQLLKIEKYHKNIRKHSFPCKAVVAMWWRASKVSWKANSR